jgi:hypothetical protein
MKLVLRNGEIKEVDTTFIFNNQYNTTDGKRIHDTEVKYIIDDIRLGEFYCSSVKQGTYEEVAQAIADTRAKINKCDGCYWFHKHTRIEDECKHDREEIVVDNRKIISESKRTVYEVSCAYVPDYRDKCVHDIDDKPRLFREVADCFFCKYPQGVADITPLREFMIANADKYDIVPYWGDQKLSVENRFKHYKPFGSYVFESAQGSYFELENARNRFKFYIDCDNKKFILDDGIGYKVVDKFTEYKSEYDYNTKQHISYHAPIKNYDKFATWFWQIVDDFNASK